MKALSIACAAAVALSLTMTACSSDDETEAGDDTVEIGIAKIVSHPSLDQMQEGAVQALADAGYVAGDNASIDIQNAQGDSNTLSTIANNFKDKDIVIAIATPTAQAMAQALPDTPIIFGAVTDPVAAGLVDDLDAPGGNLTGTSDINPIDEQLGLIKEITPAAKTVGIAYSSAEENAQVQVDLAEEAAKKLDLKIETATFTNSGEIQQAASSLKVDSYFIPTDNTLVSGLESLIQVAEKNKTLTVAADSDSVKRGAVASVAVNYQKLGETTGKMAADVLDDTSEPASMPVQKQDDPMLTVNLDAANRIGVTVPTALVDRADEVIGEQAAPSPTASAKPSQTAAEQPSVSASSTVEPESDAPVDEVLIESSDDCADIDPEELVTESDFELYEEFCGPIDDGDEDGDEEVVTGSDEIVEE